MSNAIYSLYKQSLLSGDANSDLAQAGASVAPFLALVSSSYVYSASHQYYSSLSGVIGTDQQLTTPTVVNGIFKCDNVLFSSVAAGPAVAALAIYRKNAGANTTWRLVFFEDTATGIPLTPNGGNIAVNWNTTGVFAL